MLWKKLAWKGRWRIPRYSWQLFGEKTENWCQWLYNSIIGSQKTTIFRSKWFTCNRKKTRKNWLTEYHSNEEKQNPPSIHQKTETGHLLCHHLTSFLNSKVCFDENTNKSSLQGAYKIPEMCHLECHPNLNLSTKPISHELALSPLVRCLRK